MTPPRLFVHSVLLLIPCLLSSASPTLAAKLKEQFNESWRGSWGVLLIETASFCDDSYTKNTVIESRSISSAPHRLPAGELVQVLKVGVKRSRIDILIEINEPVLLSRTDGPYKLFEPARCRVELQLIVAREWIKDKRIEEIDAYLAGLLERHSDRESAAGSESWNRREIEPLPEGYDGILEEYEAWKAAKLERELSSALDEALHFAQQAVTRTKDDPAYGAGLAAGMVKEADRNRSWNKCEKLADKRLQPASNKAPDEYIEAAERMWKQGFQDGQIVAFYLELVRQIRKCL